MINYLPARDVGQVIERAKALVVTDIYPKAHVTKGDAGWLFHMVYSSRVTFGSFVVKHRGRNKIKKLPRVHPNTHTHTHT